MDKCKTCRWWDPRPEEKTGRGHEDGLRPCACPNIADFSDPQGKRAGLDMAIYADREEYGATFETGPEFGCVHHKQDKRLRPDRLNAGRDLDGVIAEKVFGIVTPCRCKSACRCGPARLLNYSTEPAAAWHVVEAMRQKGLTAHLDSKKNGHPWTVQFNPGSLKSWPDGFATTVELAICRAALYVLEAIH